MKPRILITQFKLDLARPDYETFCHQIAEMIAAVPGLRWKIWTHDEAAGEAGGVYLFDSEAALSGFCGKPNHRRREAESGVPRSEPEDSRCPAGTDLHHERPNQVE